jgi:anti-sigma B factor antagonist
MKCTRTDLEAESRIRIDGALDALTARDVRPVFDAIVADKPRRVTVDLEALTLIDSSGVGAIVSLFKRVKADGGEVVVVGARDQPLAVLKLLKLDRVFGLTS